MVRKYFSKNRLPLKRSTDVSCRSIEASTATSRDVLKMERTIIVCYQ